MTSSLLYSGSKLDILRRDVNDERVDLVCLGLPLKRDRTAMSSSADRHSATPSVDVITAAVDLLLIPCRPSAFDLAAMASSVQLAKAAGKPAAFIMNACPARAPELGETREVLASYHHPLAPVALGDRRAFARAVATGRAVTEFDPEGKAAEEITKLWKWIRQHIGGKHGH